MVGIGDRTFGNARRIRQSHVAGAQVVTMATLACETCKEVFAIEHRAGAQDPALAARQSAWLAERFVWEHIQEKGHNGSIPLPFVPEPVKVS